MLSEIIILETFHINSGVFIKCPPVLDAVLDTRNTMAHACGVHSWVQITNKQLQHNVMNALSGKIEGAMGNQS